MRLLLTLDHLPEQALPINYQWLVASWIYRTLERANAEFSEWLHERGFGHQGKQYKLFTFSPLRPQRFRIDARKKAFILAVPPTQLMLSFYIDEALQHFIMGLFKDQHFQLKSGSFDVEFTVTGIEMLSRPIFTERMQFQLLTPLCVSRQLDHQKYADYLSPTEEDYPKQLLQNLLNKQQALHTQTITPTVDDIADFDSSFTLLSEPKSKLLTIKGIQIRGYLFDFELSAPAELLELGYYAGFGEKNSGLGMGMVRL